MAALAGLGVVVIAGAVGRAFERGRVAPTRDWTRVIAASLVVLVIGGLAVVALPAQRDLRSAQGHGQDLGRILAAVRDVTEHDPGTLVLVPNARSAGILRAVDPELTARNPLLRLDARQPAVYDRPVARADVRLALAGTRRMVWIDQAPADGPSHHDVPANLAGLGLRVVSVVEADRGWTALVLERTEQPSR